MRRAWAAQTTLTVLLAFLGAPFLHLHTAEKHGHDGMPVHVHETVIHSHLPEAGVAPSLAGGQVGELSHANHHATSVSVFAVVPNDPQVVAAVSFLVEARIELAPTPVSIGRFVLESTPRSHDPPLLGPTSPRSPPA